MALYIQFHVQLLDVSTPLWRRFLIKNASTFGDLHLAIQDTRG